MQSRAGTCVDTQMRASAHSAESWPVRTHTWKFLLCARTLRCVCFSLFSSCFLPCTCFLPLLAIPSCLQGLKSLTNHITASNDIKVELKITNLSIKTHVFTFRIKLGIKHKSMLFWCLSVSSCARIHPNWVKIYRQIWTHEFLHT